MLKCTYFREELFYPKFLFEGEDDEIARVLERHEGGIEDEVIEIGTANILVKILPNELFPFRVMLADDFSCSAGVDTLVFDCARDADGIRRLDSHSERRLRRNNEVCPAIKKDRLSSVSAGQDDFRRVPDVGHV